MKISLCSDLHVEHRHETPPLFDNADNADVLVMAGDIMVANVYVTRSYHLEHKKTFNDFLDHVSDKFDNVLWVLGNHEHYYGDFTTTYGILKEVCAGYDNIHLLEKETLVLDDVTFIGGTCWTDFLKNNPLCHKEVGLSLNDYRCITNANRQVKSYWNETKQDWNRPAGLLITDDIYDDHLKFMEYVGSELSKLKPDDQCVMITHHAPSFLSVHENYKNDTLMNGGFVSDLSEFILDHPQIKFWTHGHVHNSMDYMIGDTRVLANPLGYPGETYHHVDEYKLITFEL